jgi:hypothetical protein
MNIKDKIKIRDRKFCPAHYLPHKFPIGKRIKNEKGHIHNSKLRRPRHNIFYKFLKCPNYKFMKKNSKNIYTRI